MEKYIPDIKVDAVSDPALLLDSSDWNKIARSLIQDQKYIYAYFLGERQKNIRLAAKTARDAEPSYSGRTLYLQTL